MFKFLDLIENHYFFVSYIVGFIIWFIDIKIWSTDFIIFLILSPLLATFTGAIAILAVTIILMPVLYGIDLFKIIFCNR